MMERPAPFDVRPVVLEGRYVRLEPLGEQHLDELYEAARDAEIWRYMTWPGPRDREGMREFLDDALSTDARGLQVPFAQVDVASGRAIGSTRFFDVLPSVRALEIGYTWIGKEAWGTRLNPEAKLLLMTHAFETLGAQRVQLKTDARNGRSQAAMAKLGFKREGIIRRHMLLPDGHLRDSVYFSVLDDEWPAVKEGLAARI